MSLSTGMSSRPYVILSFVENDVLIYDIYIYVYIYIYTYINIVYTERERVRCLHQEH